MVPLSTAHALNRCSSGIHSNRPVKRNPDPGQIKAKHSPESF
jgi:hypothetical protein